jgi:hypothetical protein
VDADEAGRARYSDVRKTLAAGATQVAWAIGKIESIHPKLYDALQVRFYRLLSRSGVGTGAKIEGPLTGMCQQALSKRTIQLRVKKAEQLFCIMLAERGPDAHVADDGSGDARRKAFRSVVTAGAILLEDAGPFVFMRLRGGRSGMGLVLRRGLWLVLLVLRSSPRERGERGEDNEGKEKML